VEEALLHPQVGDLRHYQLPQVGDLRHYQLPQVGDLRHYRDLRHDLRHKLRHDLRHGGFTSSRAMAVCMR
jgi:hypothetical protein